MESNHGLIVERADTHKITLPEEMTTREAIVALIATDKQEQMNVRVHHEFNCYPLEGGYAIHRALSHKYGWVNSQPTPGFFGDKPPKMVGVNTSLTETVQVPWGRLNVPGIEGYLETGGGFHSEECRWFFTLGGVIKQRDKGKVNDLVTLINHYIHEESLYKGRAIRVEFPEDPHEADFTYLPSFIDVSTVNRSSLLLPQEVQSRLDVSLFGPIEHTQQFRDNGIPLKRGILLEGPFGVGKTIASTLTGHLCEKHGWSYILLNKTRDLKQGIEMARRYAPCVLFAEDIDQAMNDGRTEAVDGILNTIDGAEAKNTEVMVVLTTNNLKNINPAMLRAGRIDDVIHLPAPDSYTVRSLISRFGGEMLDQEVDISTLADKMEGWIPAFIQETIQRAKRAEVIRATSTGQKPVLTQGAILKEIAITTEHLALVNQKEPYRMTPEEKAAVIQANGMLYLAETISDLAEQVSMPSPQLEAPLVVTN